MDADFVWFDWADKNHSERSKSNASWCALPSRSTSSKRENKDQRGWCTTITWQKWPVRRWLGWWKFNWCTTSRGDKSEFQGFHTLIMMVNMMGPGQKLEVKDCTLHWGDWRWLPSTKRESPNHTEKDTFKSLGYDICYTYIHMCTSV